MIIYFKIFVKGDNVGDRGFIAQSYKSLFKNSRLLSQLSLTVVFGKYPNCDPLTL